MELSREPNHIEGNHPSDNLGAGIAFIYDARGNGEGGISPTITGDHQNRITDYTAIVVEVINNAKENSKV